MLYRTSLEQKTICNHFISVTTHQVLKNIGSNNNIIKYNKNFITRIIM